MKILTNVLVFGLGVGVGVWWGVKHPSEAANVASREDPIIAKIKTEVSKAKVELLQQFLSSNNSTTQPAAKPDFHQMLEQEKQNLNQSPQPVN